MVLDNSTSGEGGIVFLDPGVYVAATAQPPCAERSEAVRHLLEKYGEPSVSASIVNSQRLIEVLVSGSGMTRTIIVTEPNGIACQPAHGTDRQNPPAVVTEQPTL